MFPTMLRAQLPPLSSRAHSFLHSSCPLALLPFSWFPAGVQGARTPLSLQPHTFTQVPRASFPSPGAGETPLDFCILADRPLHSWPPFSPSLLHPEPPASMPASLTGFPLALAITPTCTCPEPTVHTLTLHTAVTLPRRMPMSTLSHLMVQVRSSVAQRDSSFLHSSQLLYVLPGQEALTPVLPGAA